MKIVVRNTSVLFFNFTKMKREVKEMDIEEQRTNEGHCGGNEIYLEVSWETRIITIYFIFYGEPSLTYRWVLLREAIFREGILQSSFQWDWFSVSSVFSSFEGHPLTRRFIAPQSFIHFPLSCLFTCDSPNSVFEIEATLGILTERNFIQGTRC